MSKTKNKILILGNNENFFKFSNLNEFNAILTFDLSIEFLGIQKKLPIFYFHRIAQSKDVWEIICQRARRWLEKWHEIEILGEKSILDIFKFRDLSLWWIVFDQLWVEKNGIFETIYYFVFKLFYNSIVYFKGIRK